MSEKSIFEAAVLNQSNGAVPDSTNFAEVPKLDGTFIGKPDKKVKFDLSKATATVHVPEVVVYEHIDFGGAEARTNLNWLYVGDWWNDRISSIVVVSGTWRFYEHANYQGNSWTLTPGYYHWVVDVGIPNDIISSFQVIAV